MGDLVYTIGSFIGLVVAVVFWFLVIYGLINWFKRKKQSRIDKKKE